MSEEEAKAQEFFVPDFREITDDGRRISIAVQVKHNGIWRTHKSDQDTVFPSDFHAHRQDEPETLDLYTGDVFSATQRQFLRTMPKKAMRYIFNQLSRSKEPEIQAKLAVTERFVYLNN